MNQSYELIVFLNSMKNVYLESKGIYKLKLTLEIDGSNRLIVSDISQPYMLFKSNTKHQRQCVSEKAIITDKVFISETMQMKFVDQQIFLLDVIGYKVQLASNNSLSLRCQLLKEEIVNQKKQAKKFQSKIKIRSIKQGICQYIEVPFQQNQINLSLCLFSILVNYQLSQEQNPQNSHQKYNNYLKQMRFYSYISQQNLLKLIKIGYTEFSQLQKIRSKQYFFVDKNLSKQQFQHQGYQLCCQNYVLFKAFLDVLQKGQYNIFDLKKKYMQQRKDKYTDFVFSRKENEQKNQANNRSKCAKKIRKSSNYLSISKKILPIQVQGQFIGIKNQPIAFHQTSYLFPNKKIDKLSDKFQNLYIMCHGFQGSTKDLVLLRNIIKHFNPNSYYLLSKCYQNEFEKNLSILQLGEKLSQQIFQFMQIQNISKNSTKLHFIGFSLGGVIARASISHLQGCIFGKYLSISSPHLGSIGSEPLVAIGLFMLKDIQKYKCINQLCFQDSKQLQNSVLYKLSEQGSLKYFEQVILISNNKDTFVPWQSARIQPIGGKIKKIQNKMINNILNNNEYLSVVHRLDFESNQPRSSIYQPKQRFQQALGRSTHMQFIKNQVMIKMMLNTLSI